MQDIFSTYLEKQSLYNYLFDSPPINDLKLIVIIPAYNEPHILNTLNSLKACTPTTSTVEVLILINHPEDASPEIKQQNSKSLIDIQYWIKSNSTNNLAFFVKLLADLPKKNAGVGLARKILMDEAIRRFNIIGNENGIIASLDADTLVSENYLSAIQEEFQKNKKLNCSIFSFEHALDSEISTKNSEAIILYELYLRYFRQAMKFTGFPYSYFTIGSCFAVTAITYVKQGGMNRRQGGEDFYFLNKVFPLGGTSELHQIKVFPSSRISDRVPFGTGPAIKKIMEQGNYYTYQFEYFIHVRDFFAKTNSLYGANSKLISDVYDSLHKSIREFISFNDFQLKIKELNFNSASKNSFIQRFYKWFDAFKIIKYLNQTHLVVARINVIDAVIDLLNNVQGNVVSSDPKTLLDCMRIRDYYDH